MFARRFAAAFCLFFCLVLLAVPAGCGGCAHRMVIVPDVDSHYMVCVECGESSAPQAHTLLRVQLTEASCTENSVALLQCACGYSETEETPPSGHDFGIWLPGEDGAHMRVCSICDEIEIEEHAFSDGFCGVCGAKQAAVDPQLVPGEGGESPLARHTEWVNTTCPACGGPARRETDTMPQWAGSSWYFLRYMDPHNDTALASPEALRYWGPVDWYNGGMEHTTLHLLYSRFWNKFLYDIGVVPYSEPYQKRTSHGMILGENGEKMSKSRGNVVNPDDIVRDYGADTMRLYEMFIGDFEKAAPWNTASIKGCRRFLERVWALADRMDAAVPGYSAALEGAVHRTIKKVTQDIENLKMNTAIAAMMSLVNEFYEAQSVTAGEVRTLLVLLNPFAPHMTEEMWENLGFEGQIAHTQWPQYDEAKCAENTVEIAVQVNGKVRARVTVAADISAPEAIALAKAEPNVEKELAGKTVVKEIYVPGKLVNLAAK